MKAKLFIVCCILHSIFGLNLTDYIMYPPQSTTRIVGGENAKDGLAPFQCSMQLSERHFCGCALISSEWIVTASHCVSGQNAKSIQILVGTNDLRSGGTRYSIEKYIIHPQFNIPMYANDIAVARIQGSINFDEKVQPIEYSSEEVPDGAVLQLTGWGRLQAGGQSPELLQVIKLNAITTEKCREIYKGQDVHDSHICTLNGFGQGACNGDSGGPLLYGNKLVGIVNWGVPCALGYPDAYAKVSYLYDFIESSTN